jgi:hypothetical protein
MTTLKPCPWCQRTDFLDVAHSAVLCLDCEAQGPIGSTEQDIVTKWNSYKGKPEEPPEVKVAIDRIKKILSGVPYATIYSNPIKLNPSIDSYTIAEWYINDTTSL